MPITIPSPQAGLKSKRKAIFLVRRLEKSLSLKLMSNLFAVEQYRIGYPRLAAFLNLDPGLTIIRRFDNLHLRVLLEQQAEVSELENRLNKCDDEETIQLHLSSCRKDGNQHRRYLIEEIKTKLREYGM